MKSIEIYRKLHTYFDTDELRDLAIRLDMDYESLSRDTKQNIEKAIISLCIRRNIISSLLRQMIEAKPDMLWIDDSESDEKALEENVSFLEEFPNTLDLDLENGHEIWMVGLVLNHRITQRYRCWMRKLEKGHIIRALLMKPLDELCTIELRRRARPTTVEEIKNGILLSLQKLYELKTITGGMGSLEIRMLDFPFSIGGYAIDPNTQGGSLYLKHYAFKMGLAGSMGSMLKFVIRDRNSEVYQYYRQELMQMWASAEVCGFNSEECNKYFIKGKQSQFQVSSKNIDYNSSIQNECELSDNNPIEEIDLSPALYQKITEFLTSLPNIIDENMKKALIYAAGLDPQLQNQISIVSSPVQFSQLVVVTFYRYGKIKDGRHAIEAILEAAKQYVGHEKKIYCDVLIQELKEMLDRNEK